MPHILSKQYYDEFRTVTQLVRFDFIQVQDKFETTLLVKLNSLLLKYILTGSRITLFIEYENGRIKYSIRLYEDNTNLEYTVEIYSYIENENEIRALNNLNFDKNISVYLFNELSCNVAENKLFINGNFNYLNNLNVEIELNNNSNWECIPNFYVIDSGQSSEINLSSNEGMQQEIIAQWIIDYFSDSGRVFFSPRFKKGSEEKELTDIILISQETVCLIESKVISIFNKGTLPNRKKLKENALKNIDKAFKQLKGAVRNIQEQKFDFYTIDNKVINIPICNNFFGIVLISDLDLIISDNLSNDTQKIHNIYKQFQLEFPVFIMDLFELSKISHAANLIDGVNLLESFFKLLANRWNIMQKQDCYILKCLHNKIDDKITITVRAFDKK
ncbi:hypothetical protein [Alysiella crassa]|uniref:NERD domain-containing protein n=1 Tax=Alysiella crassa TaxID=153491 RepID=A0A376BMF9_9NEIS|nr:hypothetical protein [Alysiella crassa]UOP06914.1 hypothetical protein LVJ80_14715 [Alysiella crassa]SSY70957.1 Uncharacterised protein [Alysiella crassa]